MRKSHEGIKGVVKDNYPDLPEELQPFNYYYMDGETGHVIMAVPECLLAEAQGKDLDLYEVPVPVLYLLEKGYRVHEDHIICDAPYDPVFGLDVDSKWVEL